jgi:predicted Zn-dependent protease
MIARRAGLLNLGGAMVKLAMIGCAGLVVTGLAGCPSNPVTGSPELALVSEAKLIAQSSAEYRREIDGLRKGGYLIEGGSDVARMQGVTDRLITQAIALRPNASHWQWEVHLVNAPGIYNAWCLPGGKMLVYSGFLSRSG